MSGTEQEGPPEVLALVAARNEEGTVGQVVKELYHIPVVRSVVVVDGGSSDGTAGEALRAGARVFTGPTGRGKGGALEDVLDLLPVPRVYLLVDGDVGETAAQAKLLLDEVMAGRLDAAIGRLPPQAGGGFGLVKRMAGRIIRLATGFDAAEPLSGQRAISAPALAACRPLAAGFGIETAMTIDAVRLGFRVGEIPVEMTHRATGRGIEGFAHRGRQGLHILRAGIPRLLGLR